MTTSVRMKEEIRSAFDARAERYARSEWHARFAERLVELSPIREGDRVLDAGTGTGIAARAAARCVGSRGRVIGVDLSPRMLEAGTADCVREGLHHVELVVGDAVDLEMEPDSVDVVLCSAALLYMSAGEALSAWQRFLRPGGFVAFSTMKTGHPLGGRLFRACAAELGVELEDPSGPLGSVDRCRGALRTAGFVPRRILEERVEMSVADLEEAWRANVGSPAHEAVHALDEERLAALRAAYLDALSRADEQALRFPEVIYAIGSKRGPLPCSERLTFCRWTASDLDLAMALWGDPEVTALIDARGKLGREEVEARLRAEIDLDLRHDVQYWPIFLPSGDLVGCAGLRPRDLDQEVYELGVQLCRSFWGRGLATEAARAVIRFAFENLRASALFAGHHPKNLASRRLLTKLGFRHTHDELYPPTGLQHPSYFLRPSASP